MGVAYVFINIDIPGYFSVKRYRLVAHYCILVQLLCPLRQTTEEDVCLAEHRFQTW